ncbi:hypothetical protein Agabi119p4_11023 [Agaricus bisporus var. burnettii]|uniref:Uncharacterized protein n=1 Tax=Agaricus bisporus var. burnettii TaxID=192524 RepID=A0A8H7EVW8_AGABI|nr:hypothetical protein Agabi119p4_11023 [Agaricus bisporus var. burnettii]
MLSVSFSIPNSSWVGLEKFSNQIPNISRYRFRVKMKASFWLGEITYLRHQGPYNHPSKRGRFDERTADKIFEGGHYGGKEEWDT